MRADRLRILDAIEQIELISSFPNGAGMLSSTTWSFRAQYCTVWRSLASHPEIPWAQIVGFRNVVIHEYFGIDLELVWTIVADYLATLKAQLNSVLTSLPD